MALYALEPKNARAKILPAERFLLRSRVRPEAAAVEKAARWLMDARRPVLLVGDEVWKSGAQSAVTALSRRLGLAVSMVPGSAGLQNFRGKHPHYLGRFDMGSDYVAKGVDLMVFVGSRAFGGRVIPTSPELPPNARTVRIGIDTAAIGRNYGTDLALIGDVREALTDLAAALGSAAST